MKYLNKFNFEETWEEFDEQEKSDFWIVENLGDDLFYFTKKVKFKVGKFYDYKYQVLEMERIEFSDRYVINTNSALPLTEKEINLIKNNKKNIFYIQFFSNIKSNTLKNICNLLDINIESVNFLKRWNKDVIKKEPMNYKFKYNFFDKKY